MHFSSIHNSFFGTLLFIVLISFFITNSFNATASILEPSLTNINDLYEVNKSEMPTILREYIAPIFPSEEFENCKTNVSNARFFAIMSDKDQVSQILFEGFKEKLNTDALEQSDVDSEKKEEYRRNADNLLRILIEKLFQNDKLSVEEICHWVSKVYAGEESLPYYYKLKKDKNADIEIIVTKVRDL